MLFKPNKGEKEGRDGDTWGDRQRQRQRGDKEGYIDPKKRWQRQKRLFNTKQERERALVESEGRADGQRQRDKKLFSKAQREREAREKGSPGNSIR